MQKCKELKKPQFNSVSLDFVRQKEKKIRPDCELISVMQLADVNAVTFKRKKKKKLAFRGGSGGSWSPLLQPGRGSSDHESEFSYILRQAESFRCPEIRRCWTQENKG